MRISDWSSDVCSSDLIKYLTRLLRRRHVKRQGVQNAADDPDLLGVGPRELALACVERILKSHPHIASVDRRHRDEGKLVARSEEHTSELQSLMRISYAVFCLKKKNTNTHNTEKPMNLQ